MKLKIISTITILTIFTACNGSTPDSQKQTNSNANNVVSEKQKELELKEKELELKEKELNLKEKDDSSSSNANKAPAVNNELSNVENLIGNWFVPHSASTNIKFQRNGNFEFNDFNTKLDKEELLTGTYKLENGTLTLLYDDRPKQNFRFYKGEKGDPNFYIKKGDYYFVKGEN